MIEVSGSGSWRPKNMWIWWLRIRNTSTSYVFPGLPRPWRWFPACWRKTLAWSPRRWSASSMPRTARATRMSASTSRAKAGMLRWGQHHTFLQCCGSGMFIPDPDFYPFRSSDPGSKNSIQREGWKKIWASSQRELFTQKFVTKLWKIWGWDPGSEIRDPEKTYSWLRIRVQGQKGTGSRIRIRNTAFLHNLQCIIFNCYLPVSSKQCLILCFTLWTIPNHSLQSAFAKGCVSGNIFDFLWHVRTQYGGFGSASKWISRIRICINLRMTSQNVWNMSLCEHFFKVLSLYLEARSGSASK